jgi:flavin reductase (DIM6/NTAB) family NADH-FMN oxidoreductase RutF
MPQFVDALAQFASGVVLLATYDDDDGDAVMTATAFSSVSLEPPLVLVGVALGGWMQESLQRSATWAVSVLAEPQVSLAARFSTPQRPSPGMLLTGIAHHRGERSGAIVLDDAVAALECVTDRTVEAGDHALLIGRVVEVVHVRTGMQPLVHHARAYHGVRPRSQ